MCALLKKDFLTSRFIYLVTTLLMMAVLFFLVKRNTMVALMVATIGSVLVPIMVNKFTATEEMRRNYDLVINSFPIKKREVVISKYMYYLIMHLITAVIFQAIVVLNNLSDTSFLITVLLIQGAAFIYYILFIGMPNYIYYKYDYDVAAKYSPIIIIVGANIPIVLSKLVEKINPNTRISIVNAIENGSNEAVLLSLVIFLVGFILYGIIVAASVRGYARRDL